MDVLQHGVVEHRFGEQLLSLALSLLECPQPSGIGHIEPAVLGLLIVEDRAADLVLAADVRCLRASLLLAQHPNDLFFRKLAWLHVRSLQR